MSLILTPFVEDYKQRRSREHNMMDILSECVRLSTTSPEGLTTPLRPTLWKALLKIPADASESTVIPKVASSLPTSSSTSDITISPLRSDVTQQILMDLELAMNSNSNHDGSDGQELVELLQSTVLYFLRKSETTYIPSHSEMAYFISNVMVSSGSQTPSSDIFHILYRIPGILTLPNVTNPIWNDLQRHILQFHDPTLSLHLDRNNLYKSTHKALLESNTGWLTNAFVAVFPKSDGVVVWDYLLSVGNSLLATPEGNAVRLLLFSAAVLIRSKAELMACAHGDDVEVAVLRNPPKAHEVVELCIALERNTPRCVGQEFARIGLLTDPEHTQPCLERLRRHFVLPINTAEIIEPFRTTPSTKAPASALQQLPPPLRYIVLDCRSEKSYNFARLPTAMHIGSRVGYDAELLRAVIDKFQTAIGSHFVVLGTGRGLEEENNLLNILALHFLQNGFPHVAVAEEGFKGVIPFIKEGTIEFVQSQATDSALPDVPIPTSANSQSNPPTSAPVLEVAAKEIKEVAEKVNESFGSFKSWGQGFIKSFSKKEEATPATTQTTKAASPTNTKVPTQQAPVPQPIPQPPVHTTTKQTTPSPAPTPTTSANTTTTTTSFGAGFLGKLTGGNSNNQAAPQATATAVPAKQQQQQQSSPITQHSFILGGNDIDDDDDEEFGLIKTVQNPPPQSAPPVSENTDVESSNPTVVAPPPPTEKKEEKEETTTITPPSVVTPVPPPPAPEKKEENTIFTPPPQKEKTVEEPSPPIASSPPPPKKTTATTTTSNSLAFLDDDFDIDSIQLPSNYKPSTQSAPPKPSTGASEEKHPFDDIFV